MRRQEAQEGEETAAGGEERRQDGGRTATGAAERGKQKNASFFLETFAFLENNASFWKTMHSVVCGFTPSFRTFCAKCIKCIKFIVLF